MSLPSHDTPTTYHDAQRRRPPPRLQAVTSTGNSFDMDRSKINELMSKIACDHDIVAFEAIYRHFHPKVRAYMIRVTKDRSMADELAQEAMMTVWRKAGQFDASRGQASTWIFTIARNLRIDTLRRGPRPEFDPNDPAFVPDDIEPADVEYDRREASVKLNQAMRLLKSEQVEVLRMSYFAGMPHSAIANALKIPLGTVKSRIRVACEKLRLALENDVR